MRGNSSFTENIKLSIWEYFDKFKMKDFNEDNINIDEYFSLLDSKIKENIESMATRFDERELVKEIELSKENRFITWRIFNKERLSGDEKYLRERYASSTPAQHIDRLEEVSFDRIDERKVFEGNQWVDDKGLYLGGRPGDYRKGLTVHPIEVVGKDIEGSNTSKYDTLSIVYRGDNIEDAKRLHYFNSFMLNLYFDIHNDNPTNDKINKYGGKFILTVSVGAFHDKPFKNKWYKPIEIFKLGWGD